MVGTAIRTLYRIGYINAVYVYYNDHKAHKIPLVDFYVGCFSQFWDISWVFKNLQGAPKAQAVDITRISMFSIRGRFHQALALRAIYCKDPHAPQIKRLFF